MPLRMILMQIATRDGGTGASRMSPNSSFLLEPSTVGSYAGGSSLSSGARIGSPDRRRGRERERDHSGQWRSCLGEEVVPAEA
jgi:hypothetical protein